LKPLAGFSEVQPEAAEEEPAPVTPAGVDSQIYDTPIEVLELSMRAYNCLKRASITRVGEILDRLAMGESELLAIRNFGQKSLDELLDKLDERGFLPAEEVGEGEGEATQEEAEKATISGKAQDAPLEVLELPSRISNLLEDAGLTSIGQILDRLAEGESEFLAIRNFGEKSLSELVTSLQDKGYLS
jgi:DNA-directed RNA polymerase alpha subunit